MQGKSMASIARKYNVTYESVSNHMKNHVSRQMVQAFRKKQSMESMDMMNEFTTLIQDIKDQIEEFKTDRKHGLTLKATDTLIKLYQVMCNFASVYYQQQAEESSQNREEIIQEYEQQQDERIKQSMEVLTNNELRIYEAIAMKGHTHDADTVLFPDGATDMELLHGLKQVLGLDYETSKYGYKSRVHLKHRPVKDSGDDLDNIERDVPENSVDPVEMDVSELDDNTQKKMQRTTDPFDTAPRLREQKTLTIPSTSTDDKETRKRVKKELRGW